MVHACTISICILLYIVRTYINFTRTQLLLIASGTIPILYIPLPKPNILVLRIRYHYCTRNLV